MGHTAGLDRLQPLIAPNAMIDVDDEIAFFDLTGLGQESIGALTAALAALQALPQNVLLCDEDKTVRLEAPLHLRDDGPGDTLRQRQRLIHRGHDLDSFIPAIIRDEATEAVKRAIGRCGEDCPLASLSGSGKPVRNGGIKV